MSTEQLEFDIGDNEEATTVEMNEDGSNAEVTGVEEAPEVRVEGNKQSVELDKYNDSVKKRIDKLTARLRETERRETAALDYAKSVQQKAQELERRFHVTDTERLTEARGRVETQAAALKAVIKNCWQSGGDPQVIMCGGSQKQVISSFAGIATLYREAGKTSKGTAIVGAADLYISDFGEHRVIPNRNQRNRTVFVLDMDYWGVAYLRPVSQKEIARTGSAQKRLIDATYTLVAMNPASSGKISDCT